MDGHWSMCQVFTCHTGIRNVLCEVWCGTVPESNQVNSYTFTPLFPLSTVTVMSQIMMNDSLAE